VSELRACNERAGAAAAVLKEPDAGMPNNFAIVQVISVPLGITF
jgi:hypothetical protein